MCVLHLKDQIYLFGIYNCLQSEGKFPEGWFGGSLGKFSCVEDRCTLLNETASAYNFSGSHPYPGFMGVK